MKSPKIHYAGGIILKPGAYGLDKRASGSPGCCTGERARKIRRDGTQTTEKARVTCVPCLKLIAAMERHETGLSRIIAEGRPETEKSA